MRLISHRGNIEGPNPEKENHPDYIMDALLQGFDVEIDVWCIDGKLMLGHDEPTYDITSLELNVEILKSKELWFHCKNLEAITYFAENGTGLTNYFWHQEDDFTLTSQNIIWTYPGKSLTLNSICVMPEWANIHNKGELPECKGVCSDYIMNFLND